jgi:hypothetical protein
VQMRVHIRMRYESRTLCRLLSRRVRKTLMSRIVLFEAVLAKNTCERVVVTRVNLACRRRTIGWTRATLRERAVRATQARIKITSQERYRVGSAIRRTRAEYIRAAKLYQSMRS